MEYKVVITSDAEDDLDEFIRYLLYEKQSEQAASNVLDDFQTNHNILTYQTLLEKTEWEEK